METSYGGLEGAVPAVDVAGAAANAGGSHAPPLAYTSAAPVAGDPATAAAASGDHTLPQPVAQAPVEAPAGSDGTGIADSAAVSADTPAEAPVGTAPLINEEHEPQPIGSRPATGALAELPAVDNKPPAPAQAPRRPQRSAAANASFAISLLGPNRDQILGAVMYDIWSPEGLSIKKPKPPTKREEKLILAKRQSAAAGTSGAIAIDKGGVRLPTETPAAKRAKREGVPLQLKPGGLKPALQPGVRLTAPELQAAGGSAMTPMGIPVGLAAAASMRRTARQEGSTMAPALGQLTDPRQVNSTWLPAPVSYTPILPTLNARAARAGPAGVAPAAGGEGAGAREDGFVEEPGWLEWHIQLTPQQEEFVRELAAGMWRTHEDPPRDSKILLKSQFMTGQLLEYRKVRGGGPRASVRCQLGAFRLTPRPRPARQSCVGGSSLLLDAAPAVRASNPFVWPARVTPPARSATSRGGTCPCTAATWPRAASWRARAAAATGSACSRSRSSKCTAAARTRSPRTTRTSWTSTSASKTCRT
jgi:hypothetical protein